MLAAASAAVSLVSFRASPWVTGVGEVSFGMESLIAASRRESRNWHDGDVIGIIGHPHPGDPGWRWWASQMIHRLFVRDPAVTILPDPAPDTNRLDRLYILRDGDLRPLPLSPGNPHADRPARSDSILDDDSSHPVGGF
jgi:hypothetical protein